MALSRKWRFVALLALLIIGAWIVLSVWALHDTGSLSCFAALLPAFFAVLASFACTFAFWAWQPPFVPQGARAACACRAPPTDLPRT